MAGWWRTSSTATGPCSRATRASTGGSSPPSPRRGSTAVRAARREPPRASTSASTRARRPPNRPGSGPACDAAPTPFPAHRSGTSAPTWWHEPCGASPTAWSTGKGSPGSLRGWGTAPATSTGCWSPRWARDRSRLPERSAPRRHAFSSRRPGSAWRRSRSRRASRASGSSTTRSGSCSAARRPSCARARPGPDSTNPPWSAARGRGSRRRSPSGSPTAVRWRWQRRSPSSARGPCTGSRRSRQGRTRAPCGFPMATPSWPSRQVTGTSL